MFVFISVFRVDGWFRRSIWRCSRGRPENETLVLKRTSPGKRSCGTASTGDRSTHAARPRPRRRSTNGSTAAASISRRPRSSRRWRRRRRGRRATVAGRTTCPSLLFNSWAGPRVPTRAPCTAAGRQVLQDSKQQSNGRCWRPRRRSATSPPRGCTGPVRWNYQKTASFCREETTLPFQRLGGSTGDKALLASLDFRVPIIRI